MSQPPVWPLINPNNHKMKRITHMVQSMVASFPLIRCKHNGLPPVESFPSYPNNAIEAAKLICPSFRDAWIIVPSTINNKAVFIDTLFQVESPLPHALYLAPLVLPERTGTCIPSIESPGEMNTLRSWCMKLESNAPFHVLLCAIFLFLCSYNIFITCSGHVQSLRWLWRDLSKPCT